MQYSVILINEKNKYNMRCISIKFNLIVKTKNLLKNKIKLVLIVGSTQVYNQYTSIYYKISVISNYYMRAYLLTL